MTLKPFELWIYDSGKLVIYLLDPEQGYQPSATSAAFPELAIAEMVTEVIRQAGKIGSSGALRELEEQLREQASPPKDS